jgi:hypothetical protein
MKKIDSKIESLVSKILNESLQEKADEMVNKIKSEMDEEEELDIENMSDDEIYDAYCQRYGCDDVDSGKEFEMNGDDSMGDFDSEEIDIEDDNEEDNDSFDWKYRHGKSNFGEAETDEEMEEGNAFTGALAKAKEKGDDEFEVGGKKFQVKEGKRKIKTYESIKLTESEMIDFIEKLVKEEKEKSNIKKLSAKGEEVYSKAHKESGKENEDYIKSVTKKLKDYLKDGSKGEYNTNPKVFPKGNGEMGEMTKKAYTPSDAAEEYIENFARMNGMEDLDYDEIHPVDDWITKNIEGSSMTGNNPEWANTGETDINKKLNKRRKKGLVRQLKRQAYNKAEQPIVSDSAGEDKEGTNTVNKIFKAVESKEDRKERMIKEEIEKMNRIVNYNQKTQ